jgi:hypothetical protein
MIGPTGTVRVMVATRPVDFRNYAERRIMRSPRESDRRRRLFETVVARCMAEGPVGGEAFSVEAASGIVTSAVFTCQPHQTVVVPYEQNQ